VINVFTKKEIKAETGGIAFGDNAEINDSFHTINNITISEKSDKLADLLIGSVVINGKVELIDRWLDYHGKLFAAVCGSRASNNPVIIAQAIDETLPIGRKIKASFKLLKMESCSKSFARYTNALILISGLNCSIFYRDKDLIEKEKEIHNIVNNGLKNSVVGTTYGDLNLDELSKDQIKILIGNVQEIIKDVARDIDNELGI